MKTNFFYLLLILLFLFWGTKDIKAQLTIEYCQAKAMENYPLIQQYNLIERIKEYNLSNAGKGYLPQFSISGKATYQSDVTKIPIDFQSLGLPVTIPELNKDQYQITADVNQNIWDGGVIHSRKESLNATAEVDKRQVDVDVYSIIDRVNQLFFGTLLLDAKLQQNELLQEELERNYNQILIYIENGVGNESDLDVVRVEQVKNIQSRIQLQSTKKSYLEMLGNMIGEDLSENTGLVKPATNNILFDGTIHRPELSLFHARQNQLDVQEKSIKTEYMPKFSLFGTAGYGRPGLNMLESNFSTYYLGGIRLSWNFGSLYTRKNDKRILETNRKGIDVQREIFLYNTNLDIINQNNEIKKFYELLRYDDEIIALREKVKKATLEKVTNGLSTVTDLMNDITSQDIAVQDKIQHEVELLLSIYNLKYTTNN